MPALNESDYAKFNQMLEELEPEVSNMKDVPRGFMEDMIDKNKLYGERVFVSPKQFDWIKKLHEEYVGDTDHGQPTAQRGLDSRGVSPYPDNSDNRDMDDDIPF